MGGGLGRDLTFADASSSSTRAISRVSLMSVELDSLTEAEVLERVGAALDREEGGWIMPVNLDVLRQLHRDTSLREMAARADVVLADGMPLVWASRMCGTPVPERVAGSDLVSSLPRVAATRGASVFLLGGDPGVAEAAADCLSERIPKLRVAGTLCPERGFERDPERLREITAAVAAAKPSVVLVGLGFPKQERLIEHLRVALPQAWFVCVGISFSFLCGSVRRAPRWMQATGLEWLHRVAQEPRRLTKRYLIHGLPFAARLLIATITLTQRST
jgi:N-acetylglucosaminyldiphosphoundecaprenol N-acetyl-beta-D-mannosaminyltransferase